MRLQIVVILLGAFMMMSFTLCFITGMAMPQQMECVHYGSSVCAINDDDCCLTESNKARIRTQERELKSGSHGDLYDTQWIKEEFLWGD